MNVCVLGAGAMGSAMTARMLERSFDVRIWDRTWEKAEALGGAGARAFRDIAEAVADADVVVTMLADGAAVTSTISSQCPGAWNPHTSRPSCAVPNEYSSLLR